MNKTVVVLSIATAAFATSTVYLAHELRQRESDETRTAAIPTNSPTSGASAAMSVAKGVDSADSVATPTSSPVSGAPQRTGTALPANEKALDPQADAVNGFARQFLARYDDSIQHPVLLDEQRTVIRRQYEKLKGQLKLSDSAFEQLVTLLAEEQLQSQEKWARCAVDSACDPKNMRVDYIDHTQEYQAMLGMDGAEAFTQFRKSIGERDTVIQLRGRLTDTNFLPEAQAEKLIVALAEERERFTQEASARGAKVSGWGTNLGMLMYTEDSGIPDQYIAEASQYNQRLRNRAASILTPAQLAAYTQMQNELLAMFTANHRPPQRQNKSSLVRSS
jgi:hypothetical protein